MTISSQLNRVSTNGNDVTTAFPVSFPFHAQADLVVLSTVIATGVQTVKTITTHYTISGSTDPLGHYSNGGTVNFLVAPASTERITIYRDPSRIQALDLVNNDNLPAESVEASIDYQTMLIQRVSDLISRSLRQPDGDSANIGTLPSSVERASKFQAFDSSGNPIAAAGTSANLGPVSSFINTLLDDADKATAQATLDVLPATSPATLTGASTPALSINTTHATNKTAQIQFKKSGTTQFILSVDFAQAGATDFTIYDGVAAADRLVITSAGVVSLPIGQLKFPATQNASADANTLDDYEEGNWTPSVGGTATYTSQIGRYVKIGKVVYIQCLLIINAIGSGSTNVISGLPFTVNAVADGALAVCEFASLATNVVWIAGRADVGNTTITLRNITAAAASATTSALFQNATSIELSGFYFI